MFVAAGAWLASSCAPSGFADPSLVSSVRILASSADQPYARPGAAVTVQVLAVDERPSKPEPMTVYWLPLVCENPANDAYYACFQQFAKKLPGGAAPKPGTPLTGLPTGPSYSFQMPADAVTAHPPVAGAPVPYGLAILFDVACAGHLELVPVDGSNPQAMPIGCFDSSGNALGPDDWVLGFTRVYAYDSLTNADPLVDSLDVAGTAAKVTAAPQGEGAAQVYTTGTITMTHCTTSDGSGCQVKIGPVVPSSSWEVNPEQTSVHGGPLHEEIWADYYASLGQMHYTARLLYDATAGSVGAPSDTDDEFQPPDAAGDGSIWIVVHDNRGGAAWVTVPVHVE